VAERRTAARNGAALALALALVAGAAGCGGGDSGPSTTETFKQGYQHQRTALNAISDQVGTVLTGADGKPDEQVTSELRAVETK
jgi:hypothetical protein